MRATATIAMTASETVKTVPCRAATPFLVEQNIGRDDHRADDEGFASTFGTGMDALGKCVSARAKTA